MKLPLAILLVAVSNPDCKSNEDVRKENVVTWPAQCAFDCSPYKALGFKTGGWPGCICSFEVVDGGKN